MQASRAGAARSSVAGSADPVVVVAAAVASATTGNVASINVRPIRIAPAVRHKVVASRGRPTAKQVRRASAVGVAVVGVVVVPATARRCKVVRCSTVARPIKRSTMANR
jgi:hypothetical protein